MISIRIFNKTSSVLPKEFQQVEYIESDGFQYIDTGIVMSDDIGIQVGFAYTTSSTAQGGNEISLFGVGGTTSSNFCTFTLQLNYFNAVYYGGTDQRIRTFDTNYHKLEFNFGSTRELVFDDTKYKPFTKKLINSRNLYLFKNNQYNFISGAQAKIYYCKLIDNQTNAVLRDYVPCFREADNAIGLYDLVNNVFYTNGGTGTFSKGYNIQSTIKVNLNILSDNSIIKPRVRLLSSILSSKFQQVEYTEKYKEKLYEII